MSDNTLNVASRVVPTVNATTLDVQATYQISATVTDVYGNVIDNAPLYYLSYNPNIATVDSNGLVTAIDPGSCVIEVASPTGGNECGFADNSLPLVKIYARIDVLVEEQAPVIPSFTLSGSNLSADASSGSASTTITVTPENGFTGIVYLFAFTATNEFDNNPRASSVQTLATTPGLILGFPVTDEQVFWNNVNATVNVASDPATFALALTWDGGNPPPTGEYTFDIIGSVTPRWSVTAPLSPDVSTVSLTLTLS